MPKTHPTDEPAEPAQPQTPAPTPQTPQAGAQQDVRPEPELAIEIEHEETDR